MRIELHHIKPKADGGPDTFDNAIALCFDCHADVGNYNPAHPRGRRMGPSELRLARKRWYAIVASGKTTHAPEDNPVHCRYIICESYAAFVELTGGDFRKAPIRKIAALARTPVYPLHRDLASQRTRSDYVEGMAAATRPGLAEAYRDYPGASGAIRAGRRWQPSRREVEDFAVRRDRVSRELLVSGAPMSAIISKTDVIEPSADGCGDHAPDESTVRYRLAPFRAIYLALTNHAKTRVVVEAVRGRGNAGARWTLPVVQLSRGETLLVPIGSAVLRGELPEPISLVTQGFDYEHPTLDQPWEADTQEFAHRVGPSDVNVRWIGPRLRPSRLELMIGSKASLVDVHPLDFANIYTLNRYFAGGSCPHIFAETAGGILRHLGHALVGPPNVERVTAGRAPRDAIAIVIAELECETTQLARVTVDGRLRARDATLRPGDWLRVPVRACARFELIGRYEPWVRRNQPTRLLGPVPTVQRFAATFTSRQPARSKRTSVSPSRSRDAGARLSDGAETSQSAVTDRVR